MKRMCKVVFPLALCIVLVFGIVHANQHQCSNGKISPYAVQAAPGYDHDKFGTSSSDCLLQEFSAFISCFDTDDDDDGDGVSDSV